VPAARTAPNPTLAGSLASPSGLSSPAQSSKAKVRPALPAPPSPSPPPRRPGPRPAEGRVRRGEGLQVRRGHPGRTSAQVSRAAAEPPCGPRCPRAFAGPGKAWGPRALRLRGGARVASLGARGGRGGGDGDPEAGRGPLSSCAGPGAPPQSPPRRATRGRPGRQPPSPQAWDLRPVSWPPRRAGPPHRHSGRGQPLGLGASRRPGSPANLAAWTAAAETRWPPAWDHWTPTGRHIPGPSHCSQCPSLPIPPGRPSYPAPTPSPGVSPGPGSCLQVVLLSPGTPTRCSPIASAIERLGFFLQVFSPLYLGSGPAPQVCECVCVCVRFFRDRGSRTICPGLASNLNPPDLCLLSS
jgi:hypothetical protein